MKILNLKIENFKAVRKLEMNNLGDVVLIAGPNGCGKSCVLDAIRFLKSAYAGYRQQNEWQHFFSEFQLDINNPDEVLRLFYDREKPLSISADFSLTEGAITYIKEIARKTIYKNLFQQQFGRGAQLSGAASDTLSDPEEVEKEIDQYTDQYTKQLLEGLEQDVHSASVVMDGTSTIRPSPNLVLQFVFGTYDPANIGIFEYHPANRTYQREKVGGINVNIQQTSDRLAQHALFQLQNKYSNIKSELAAAYIRDLFIEKAGGEDIRVPSIVKTMEELFELFLPGKKFAGPKPGKLGELTFPVKLDGGGEHDIDDLSSGEKELVYGYLRLRNVSPLNSIIMIDEPELHLNPRLVLGLPNFYRKHLGLELNNQLWMTTHSDAFLRDAYKGGGFTIYHMSPPAAVGAEDNQTVPISADDEINHAMFALVGDIAGFRPGNKVVIFESSENASFDASMTKRLFPEFADRINALSGDNKSGVKQLYAALNKAVAQMALPFNIYAIFDKDSAQEERSRQTRAFSWNVYHIENYLLEEQFISKVIKDNPSHATAMTEEQISAALRRCAKESLRPLIAHRMRKSVHATFSQCLDLGFDPNIDDPAVGLTQAVARVAERIQNKSVQDLNSDKLSKMRADIATALEKSLVDESWRTEFRGRDILKLFVGRYLVGLPYDAFRDAIVARMGDAGWRPPGMAAVIERILFDGDPFQAAKGH